MIVGLVSDAHGNPTGLLGCLRALGDGGAERVYFLGDAVGYFPEVNAVLDLLRAANAVCLRGNHEAYLLGELAIPEGREDIYRTTRARTVLEPPHQRWMAEWPTRLAFQLDGVRFLLVHGSPADPLQGYIYPDTELASFASLPADVVFLGHTHRPFQAAAGRVTVVNVGSSGMPRDDGHLAACALYDTRNRHCEILRVPFDAQALIAKWGSQIHPTATECLRRTAPGGVVGRPVGP